MLNAFDNDVGFYLKQNVTRNIGTLTRDYFAFEEEYVVDYYSSLEECNDNNRGWSGTCVYRENSSYCYQYESM